MPTARRRIALFTGNRAEYGMQFPILRAIDADPRLDYQLLVSGAHLKDDFGKSVTEIENDGFKITRQIEMDTPGDDMFATATAIGIGTTATARALTELAPDLVIVYADRFESFAAMIASTQSGFPTAHVEGGDYTEGGALDDSVRHAMTKLAHLHFTTNDEATERILGLGEEPWRVKTVGLPALDLIRDGLFTQPDEIYSKYGFDSSRPVIVFTQHSVATEYAESADQIRPALQALKEVAEEVNAQVLITYPNDDAGGRLIMAEINKVPEQIPGGFQITASVGRPDYHGLLNIADVCVGNSSSGIKETAAFHCPSVNIGSRQQGRLRADNIIDVGYVKDEIKAAILKSLNDEQFAERVRNAINPYGAGDAGHQIADFVAKVDLDTRLLQKRMTY
jgi:UDP-hydrolysing UDP-N-acetyl-D-glucosamine 2-epimerase